MFMKLILKQSLTNIKERKQNILIVNLLQRLMQGHIKEGINTHVIVVKVTINPGEGSINPTKKFMGNSKKNPPMFNEVVEKGEETKASLSGMKKYF